MHEPFVISVIVPVLNEFQRLSSEGFLSMLENLQCEKSEVIFVDGGSEDGSSEYLTQQGLRVVSSKPGRARQMNAGAALASGETLLFLHCDTELKVCLREITSELEGKKWGFFSLHLDKKSVMYRLIAAGIRLRAKVFSVASGDQGIFVDAELFRSVGAYAEIDLMEDIALSRKLKKIVKPSVLPFVIEASARRWQQSGPIRMIVFMWWIQLAYKLGVSPTRLNIWYRRPFNRR